MKFFYIVCLALAVVANPLHAQEAMLDELQRENTRLKAEIAALRAEGAGQCGPALGQGDRTVNLLMQKLSQLQDDAALAALGPPPSPIVLPDTVLQSLVPDQYILTLAEGAAPFSTPAEAAAAFGLDEGQVLYTYSVVLNGFSAVLSDADRARLAADPRIAGVEQDGFVFPAQEAAGVGNPGDADSVALLPPSPDLVDVYVFDSGIRAGHSALSGLVGQGFTSFRNGIGTEDCNGHGTHVAGSIGGRQFGQTARARLVSVKVLDRDSYGDVSTVIAGVEWVLAQPGPKKIANMSLTRLDPAPSGKALLDRAVLALIRAGIPVVVAAGNSASDARLYSPARLPEVITVGAMAGDQVAASSNTGEGVDLYVEGAGVASASLADRCGYERMTGTSMAAARVTGAAVELLADGAVLPTLLPGLLAQADQVETGDFAGEVTRFVLPLREGDLAALCDGKALEISTAKRP
jgi:subtilisin family serine protease